jgi:hypothetical protein
VYDEEASADKHSIEFLPVTVKEAEAFSELLLNECVLRGIDIFEVGEEDRRDELRNHLATENEIRIFQANIAHLGDKEGSLYTSLYAIPCILHMENRCNLKAMTMLFIDGLSNAQGSLLPTTLEVQNMDTKETLFVGSIEDTMNSEILGDEFNRAFWRLPVEKEQGSITKKIGIVSLSNGRSRKVLESFDDLIDLCIVNPNKSAMWKEAWDHYRKAMVILRKKGEDYTTEEMTEFQGHIDIFFSCGWAYISMRASQTIYTCLEAGMSSDIWRNGVT